MKPVPKHEELRPALPANEMRLVLTDQEQLAIADLATKLELSPAQVVRRGLRMLQGTVEDVATYSINEPSGGCMGDE